MAALTPTAITKAGVDLDASLTAADGAGETFKPDSRAFFVVKNADTASHTVTFATPGELATGDDFPDKQYTIAAGTQLAIPVLDVYRDPVDGLIHVSYDATTSVTRGLFRR